MPRYELIDGTSKKFWEIALEATSLKTTYGRIGTKGQETTKQFSSKDKAETAYNKLIAEKVTKGYRLVHAGTKTAPTSAPLGTKKVGIAPLLQDEGRGRMRRRLIYRDERSARFWEVCVEGTRVTERWGRLATEGTSRQLRWASHADARRAAEELLRRRLKKKGYIDEATDTGAPTVGARNPANLIVQHACATEDAFYVLYTAGGKSLLSRYKDDGLVSTLPVAKGMWLVTAFGDSAAPSVIVSSQKGKMQWIEPTGRKHDVSLGGTIGCLTAWRGTPYATAYGKHVYRFDRGTWARIDTARLRTRAATFDTALVPTRERLFFLTSEGSRHALFAFDGLDWEEVHVGRDDYHTVVVAGSRVILVGEFGFLELTARAQKPWSEEGFDPWAAVAIGRTVFLSEGRRVMALAGDKLVDTRVPPDARNAESSADHCLIVSTKALYFARRDGVHVLRENRWRMLAKPQAR